MSKPVFRVVGLVRATCESEYSNVETMSHSTANAGDSIRLYSPDADTREKSPQAKPSTKSAAVNAGELDRREWNDTVSVRVRDFVPALQKAIQNNAAWLRDFGDDPVVISKDFYDVLLAYDRLRKAG